MDKGAPGKLDLRSLDLLEERRRGAPGPLRRPPSRLPCDRRRHLAVHVRCGGDVELWLLRPEKPAPELVRLVAPLYGRPNEYEQDLVKRLRRIERLGHEVLYPDAEEHDGRPELRVTLPGPEALDALATTLARILAGRA